MGQMDHGSWVTKCEPLSALLYSGNGTILNNMTLVHWPLWSVTFGTPGESLLTVPTVKSSDILVVKIVQF